MKKGKKASRRCNEKVIGMSSSVATQRPEVQMKSIIRP